MDAYTQKADRNDVEIYWADGECKNGVPVKEQISLGYKNTGTSMELAGVQVMVFLEKEEDAKELMETWKGKLEEWRGEEGVKESWGDTQMQLRKEDSGSYIAVNYYPMVSEERSQEFPEVTWEAYSAVSVYLWLPEERI